MRFIALLVCLFTLVAAQAAHAVTGKIAVVGFGTSTQAQMQTDATMIADTYRKHTWGDLDLTPAGIFLASRITAGCTAERGTALIFEQAAALLRAAGHEPLDYFRIVVVVPSTPSGCSFAGWGMLHGRWAISVNRGYYLHEVGHTLGLFHNHTPYSPMSSAKSIGAHEKAKLDWFMQTGAFFRVAGANFPDANFPKWAYPAEPCYWDWGCEWRPSWLHRAALNEVVAISPIDLFDSLIAGAQLVVHTLESGTRAGQPDYFVYADYQIRDVASPRVVITSAGAPNQMSNPTDPLTPVSTSAPSGERASAVRLGELTPTAPTLDLCNRGLRVRLISMDAADARVVFEPFVCPPPTPEPPPPPPPSCTRGNSGKPCK